MITDGFFYIAVLIFIAALIVSLPRIFRGRIAGKFFSFVPPIVLIYLGLMVLCSCHLWDLKATSEAYSSLKNPILYAMIFLMLLRCDMKKILRLGPKMLIAFFSAALSIGLGFILAYALMKGTLGADSWQALGALSGSWFGGSGNMLAIQTALNVDESMMAYALVIDSVCYTFYVMFLLWAIGRHEKFNAWTKADTSIIDSVGEELAEASKANTSPLIWQNILLLTGAALFVSAVTQKLGTSVAAILPFFDKATWTVLIVTVLGVLLAMTPFGKLKGTEEISNVMLYIIVALIASRADFTAMENAHFWLITGVMILLFHVVIMVLLAKLLHLDIFTCCVASLANIGGTASAPVLAGAYSTALVPVGILMALLGYVVGTGGGLLVARIMQFIS